MDINIYRVEDMRQCKYLFAHRGNKRLPLISTLHRFFATGSFYYSTGDMHGPAKATVCRAVHAVSDALVARCLGAVRFPTDEEGRRRAERLFHAMAGMPEVMGE